MAEKLLTVEDFKQAELGNLRERVMQAGGKVIVIVHPFYLPGDRAYKQALRKLVAQQKTPVLILEDADKISKLKQRLAKWPTGNCIILPTLGGEVKLILKLDGAGRQVLEERGKELGGLLKEAGARKVFLGGTMTVRVPSVAIARHERRLVPEGRMVLASNTIGGGCVGLTYRRLIISGLFGEVRLLKNACFRQRPEHPVDRKLAKPPKRAERPKRCLRK